MRGSRRPARLDHSLRLWAPQGVSALPTTDTRRGPVIGVVDPQAAIKRDIAGHNRHAEPVIWTRPATDILAAVSLAYWYPFGKGSGLISSGLV